jgi:hypothetical protein
MYFTVAVVPSSGVTPAATGRVCRTNLQRG